MNTWLLTHMNEIMLIVKILLPVLIVLLVLKLKPELPASLKTLFWQICFAYILLVPFLNQLSVIELPWITPPPPDIHYQSVPLDTHLPIKLPVENTKTENTTNYFWLSVYLIITALLLKRFIRQSLNLMRLKQSSKTVTNETLITYFQNTIKLLGIKRDIRLLQSRQVNSPMTWGFIKPVVLIPENGNSFDKTKSALIHELSHIRRNDWLWLQISNLICCFAWINPMLWFSRYQSINTMEQACDENVLNAGILPSEYAGALIFFHQNNTQSHVAAMAAHTHLYYRLNKVLTTNRRKDMKIWQTLLLIITLNLIFITMGCSRVTAATKHADENPQAVIPPMPPKPEKSVHPESAPVIHAPSAITHPQHISASSTAPELPALAHIPPPPLPSGIMDKKEIRKMTQIQLEHAEKALLAAKEHLKNYKMPDLKELEKQIMQSEKMLTISERQIEQQKQQVLEQLEVQMQKYEKMYGKHQLSAKEKEEMAKEFENAKKQALEELEKAKIDMAEVKKQVAMELKNIDMNEIQKQIDLEKAEIEKSLQEIRKQREQLK